MWEMNLGLEMEGMMGAIRLSRCLGLLASTAP